MEKAILRVRDLCYSYENSKDILKNINIDIFEGEKVAVIGSNGSGKSTFFLNLNGVLKARRGEIYYRDIKLSKKTLKEIRKNIGIVFQDADSQIIAPTVWAELGFGPMNLKLSREEVRERIDRALQYMNIVDLKDKPPHHLSGGEKKRVAIASIVAMESPIIIFDEPTASLDPLNVDILESVLDKLTREKKTLIVSTHDMDFAYRWADRVLVFNQGEIIGDGWPLEVFKDRYIMGKINFKRPMLLEVYERLLKGGLVEKGESEPRSIEDLKKYFKK